MAVTKLNFVSIVKYLQYLSFFFFIFQRSLNAAKGEQMNKMEKPLFESKKPQIPPENKVTHDKVIYIY